MAPSLLTLIRHFLFFCNTKMEDENATLNMQLQASEHEQLISKQSDEMSPKTKVCAVSASDTSGNKTPGEELSDFGLRSDDNSPFNESLNVETTKGFPGNEADENTAKEDQLPNSSDLVLRHPATDIAESEHSEPALSEAELSGPEPSEADSCPEKSLDIEITQLSDALPEPIEVEVPENSSLSPEPIDIDIPEPSESSPEVPELPDKPTQEFQDRGGSDADNECSDEEPPRTLSEWQLRQLAENALEIALNVSTPKSSASILSDSNICKPRTPLPERTWKPSTTDPTQANKPKCPPCERKKKRFDCLGAPPCNECSKRNMTAEQCASYAPVRRRGKRRIQDDDDDDGMIRQRGKRGKRGKRR